MGEGDIYAQRKRGEKGIGREAILCVIECRLNGSIVDWFRYWDLSFRHRVFEALWSGAIMR